MQRYSSGRNRSDHAELFPSAHPGPGIQLTTCSHSKGRLEWLSILQWSGDAEESRSGGRQLGTRRDDRSNPRSAALDAWGAIGGNYEHSAADRRYECGWIG